MNTQEAMEHFSIVERLEIKNAIDDWIIFHGSCVKTKTPRDLRVCYLAGDNPMNDLEVLLDNGILAQNIWAIEKDPAMVQSVVETVNHPGLKKLKLFEGDLIDFLKDVEGQFDIIYYDACSTLPAPKQKTLKVIGTVFLYDKLTSPGALITNFSCPPEYAPEQDTEERNRITFLAEKYLEFRKLNTPAFQDQSEKNENIPANLNTTLNTRTVEHTYSDYVTYQIIDSAAVYIPTQRMLLSGRKSLWDQLYTNKFNFLQKVKLYDTGEEYSQTSSESYLRKIGSAVRDEFNLSGNILCRNWLNEIFPEWKTSSLKKEEISSLLLTHHISCSEEFIGKFANKDFQERCSTLKGALDPDTHGSTPSSLCDTLDAASAIRLVGGIHYGQLANPSFPVVDKLLRLCYTAKTRIMFSDVFIFDKCRYFYDQFPSVHFGIDAIKSEQQMLMKMLVNGLRTHLGEICYDQFCNIADLHLNTLQIPQRQNVDVDSVLQLIVNLHCPEQLG